MEKNQKVLGKKGRGLNTKKGDQAMIRCVQGEREEVLGRDSRKRSRGK